MAQNHGITIMSMPESPESVLKSAAAANKNAAMKQSRPYLEIFFGTIFAILFQFYDIICKLRKFFKNKLHAYDAQRHASVATEAQPKAPGCMRLLGEILPQEEFPNRCQQKQRDDDKIDPENIPDSLFRYPPPFVPAIIGLRSEKRQAQIYPSAP